MTYQRARGRSLPSAFVGAGRGRDLRLTPAAESLGDPALWAPGLTRPQRRLDIDSDSSPSTKCILDLATAAAIAERELQLAAGEYRTAVLTTFPDPRRGAHETYRLTIAGVEADAAWRVRSWARPLVHGGLMEHRLASVASVALTDPGTS